MEAYKGQITRNEAAPGKPITGISFDLYDYGRSFAFHDADLAALRPLLEHLSELRDLDLRFTDVTDQGLTHLKGLTQLATLRLGTSQSQVNASKLTRDAVAELQEDLPHTTIYFYEPDRFAQGRASAIMITPRPRGKVWFRQEVLNPPPKKKHPLPKRRSLSRWLPM